MEKVLFADTFKKGFNRVFKIPAVFVENPLFRLHYKITGLALLFASIMVTGSQFFGEPIKCIKNEQIKEQILNTYCWIEGTFSLPKALDKKVGSEVVYPGIDKFQKGDAAIEHGYYQWVCFVLLFQAVVFCGPYALWRSFEGGKIKRLVKDLKNPVLDGKPRKEVISSLAEYYANYGSGHSAYAWKFVLCEFLNAANVIAQIFFLNKFLGGYFLKYGVDVVRYANMDQKDRIDPMIKLFPRMAKCTFHYFGSSGDVQKYDSLCILPLNILNEKVFVCLWFWLVILAVLGGLLFLYRLIVFISGDVKFFILSSVSCLTENQIKPFFPMSFGNWFMLYLIIENLEVYDFRYFLAEYKRVEKEKEANDGLEVVVSGPRKRYSRANESDV